MTAAAASWPSTRVRLIVDTRVLDFTYGRKRENRQKRMSEVHGEDTRAPTFSTHSGSGGTRILPLQERAFELPQMSQSVRRAAPNGLLNFNRLLLRTLRNAAH